MGMRQREQQEAAEKEAAQFRARPMPASSGMGNLGFFARPASSLPLTIPKPFELASETRHQEVLDQSLMSRMSYDRNLLSALLMASFRHQTHHQ